MIVENLAENEITLLNGISVRVHAEHVYNNILYWFENAYLREEYEEYGMENEWDQTEEFCSQSQRKPHKVKNIKLLNQRINEINKYHDNAGFHIENGMLQANSGL